MIGSPKIVGHERLRKRRSRRQRLSIVAVIAASLSNSHIALGLPNDIGVASNGAGRWVAVWSGIAAAGGSDREILMSRSSDAGVTWSAPAPMNAGYQTDTGNDEAPSIATDGAGTWLVAWSSNDPTATGGGSDGDLLIARSVDNGSTWTGLGTINAGATTDFGRDDGVAIATDGAGTWLVAWGSDDPAATGGGTDGDIVAARSVDNGTTWNTLGTINSGAATDTGRDEAPSIATDGAGTWLVAWSSNDPADTGGGADSDLLGARSVNNG